MKTRKKKVKTPKKTLLGGFFFMFGLGFFVPTLKDLTPLPVAFFFNMNKKCF